LDLGEPPCFARRRAIRSITRFAFGFAGGSAAIPLAKNKNKLRRRRAILQQKLLSEAVRGLPRRRSEFFCCEAFFLLTFFVATKKVRGKIFLRWQTQNKSRRQNHYLQNKKQHLSILSLQKTKSKYKNIFFLRIFPKKLYI